MVLLNQREAAAMLRLSERTLERMRLLGTGPRYVKASRLIRYRDEDLESWIAARTRTSTSELEEVVR
jgi:predicted DNA-binding transcriptional regulator AlpA